MQMRFNGDTLMQRDRLFEVVDQPLEQYFDLIGTRPAFEPTSTEGRGYAATWVIEDGWLFLSGLAARWSDDQALTMQHLFPFAGRKVFAAWYNGPVRAYRRDRPLPDLSDPERVRYPDLMLSIEHGRIANSVLIDRSSMILPESRVQSDDPRVVEIGRYRRAAQHGAWADAMV